MEPDYNLCVKMTTETCLKASFPTYLISILLISITFLQPSTIFSILFSYVTASLFYSNYQQILFSLTEKTANYLRDCNFEVNVTREDLGEFLMSQAQFLALFAFGIRQKTTTFNS